MLKNFEEMKNIHDIIKAFCAKYRHELTVTAGVICEQERAVSCEDYIKFMDSLSIEEFTGNYLTALLNDEAIAEYKKILNGEKDFYDFVEENLGKYARELIDFS